MTTLRANAFGVMIAWTRRIILAASLLNVPSMAETAKCGL
jgi:hypothetical protein